MANKTEYCLTCNGKKLAIVASLDDARMYIGSNSIDVIDGQYIQSKVVGSLVAFDIAGNRWSVCRVSKSVAAIVEASRKRRHDKAFQAFLAQSV